MELLDVLERSYAHSERVIAGVSSDDFDRPTPCPEWNVRALLDHYIGAVAMFPGMLRGEQPDVSGDNVGSDPTASFRAAVAENLEAWRAPGALDTPVGAMPGVKLVELNLCDALVHTWDLATATDQDPTLPEDLAEVGFALVSAWPLDASRSMGAFGPEVPVAADAPATDRLVGLVGRQP